ncbi:hypothetical protein F2Q69_00013042 [Brassica cretica]|uniref:Uncharacterized protein n=1 Tax=Brassica cretica TaxID=69181 RepID=A0A8S9R9I6_BRACR|nr:hypothetical protein F2Q69_00013042 [Brassica cretica]
MSCITSVVGKGKRIGNSNGKGVSDTSNIVMVDRWIMYYNGSWYFKIDNDRISRALDCSTIRGVEMLKDSILQEYVEITNKDDYQIFRTLHREDKSVNVFVTFMDFLEKK